MLPRNRLLQALCFGTLLALVGCSVAPTPIDFNDRLAGYNRRLATVAVPFRTSVRKLEKGTMPNPGEVRTNYDAVGAVLSDIKAEVNDMLPPSGSVEGSDLLGEYKKFLSGQDLIYRHMQQIVEIVEDAGTPDPGAKWARIDAELKAIAGVEAQPLRDLEKLQGEFSQKNNLKLVITKGKG